MSEDFEELLKDGLFDPSDDFVDRVMAKIAEQPLPDFPAHTHQARERILWLPLICASLYGIFQLVTFMFGIWLATSAS